MMFNIFNYRYLDRNHLKGFENYKYTSKDTSPLSNYLMHPFWNLTVKIVPLWLAPNVLTFVGFLFTVTNGLLLSIFDPEFYASCETFPAFPPIPAWVWLLCAVLHFLAHTLDGIDGKHARRTKSSGPLGELMDHGMDSWTTFFIPFCIYSIFGRADYSQDPLHMLYIFWSIYVTFYLSHWEKYNTGVLYLPWSYDASQIGLFALYLVTYYNGYEYWKFMVPVLNVNTGRFFELMSYVCSYLFSVPVAFYNVYTCKTAKQPNLWESIRPLISLVILFLISTLWAIFSPNKILETDPRTFYFLVGVLFSNIACRLIVSQMSSTRCELFNLLLIPVAFTAMSSIFWNLQGYELLLLRLITLATTLFHIHYAICVVRQMCEHFGIYCFTLGKRQTKSPELENLGKKL